MQFDQLKRRSFITLLGGAAATWPLAARAQQPTMPVIGFLSAVPPSSTPKWVDGFRRGLAETGYEEGRNLAVEYRWSDSDYDRLPALAADLIERRVAVIVAVGVDPAHAAKTATTTIPIVFFMSGDPVAENLVSSLNQPTGNLTGVTTFAGLLTSKRLELLRELAPSARIAALMNPNNSNAKFRLKEIEEASRILDLRVEIVNTRNADEIDGAFASLLKRGTDALLVVDDQVFYNASSKLVALAMRNRIPTMYPHSEFAEVGGLISYASNYAERFRQVGIYTAQILKGAKPAELPVDQPTKFQLVINLNTARALGLSVPQSLLARADEVIE
jgi:putative tryptophan/tyrosine transport system substrate-binding protein